MRRLCVPGPLARTAVPRRHSNTPRPAGGAYAASGGTRNKYGVRGNHSRMWVAGTSGLALGGPFAIAHPIARYARRLALFSCTQSFHRESKSSYVFLILRRMIYRFISRYHANRIRFDPVVSAGRRVGIRGARAAAVRTEGVTLSVSRGAAADRRDRTADRTADRTGRGAVGPCCRVPDAAVSAVASFGRTPSIRAPRELHKALLSGAPQTHRGTPNKQLPVALPKARCHVL